LSLTQPYCLAIIALITQLSYTTMKVFGLMEKTIAAFEARRKFGKILQEVAGKGDKFVVERHGEPVAAVVPMEVYENWKRQRTEFFDLIRSMQQEANLDPEEAEQVANEAVQAVRAKAQETP